MKRQYDYIDIDLVNWDINSLVNHIKDSKKWMIFTSTKDEGAKIEEKLNEGLNPKEKRRAVFISADNKSKGNSKAQFDKIIDEQKFDCDYLISTSVLDNGVSIKDETVKGIIVYDIFDRIEILQMIGRVRVNETNARLLVRIKVPNIGFIYKDKLKHLFATLIPVFSTDSEKEDLNILNDKVKQFVGKEYKNLFIRIQGWNVISITSYLFFK